MTSAHKLGTILVQVSRDKSLVAVYGFEVIGCRCVTPHGQPLTYHQTLTQAEECSVRTIARSKVSYAHPRFQPAPPPEVPAVGAPIWPRT